MGINFPESPTAGQVFRNGTTKYTYTDGRWLANPAGRARQFNLFVNPQFRASQQNGNTASAAVGYYPADQWAIYGSAATWASAGRVASTTSNSSPYLLRVTVSVALASPAAADYWGIFHFFEGHRVMPLGYGTALAKPSIVRFWVKAPAGTYGVVFRNSANTRCCVFSYTISAGQANTAVMQTLTLPPETTGTWPKETAVGMSMAFLFMGGTTYQTATLGTWQNGTFMVPTGITNGFASTSNVFEISDVGWYVDFDDSRFAPAWENRSEVDSLMESMRYWSKGMGGAGVSSSATAAGRVGFHHPVLMRAAPSLAIVGAPTLYDGSVNSAFTIAAPYSNPWYYEMDTTTSGLTAGRQVMLTATAANYIACNARLV
jgi:hypothetical protein